MMEELNHFDFYLGTVAGSLIHFNIGKNCKKTFHLRHGEKCEITALSWGRTHQEVLLGYKKGNAKIYNLATEESINISAIENSKIVGVVPFNDYVLLATNKGNLYQWSKNSCQPYLKNEDENKTVEKIIVNPFDINVLGVGGVNNDIKLYDISTKKIVFQGKSDRHDELELAQPISINDFAYFDNKSGFDIGTVTRQGQIRIYDTRAQRRPVKIYKNTDLIYTTICSTNAEHEIVVGSSKGYLQVMDLRGEIKPLKTFKGFMGGLTDVVCAEESPFVASCCLDRHFRVHNLQDKKLEYEEYIKIQSPLMLMRSKKNVSPPEEEDTIEDLILDDEDSSDELKKRKKSKKLKIA